jgi:hypothetical protein
MSVMVPSGVDQVPPVAPAISVIDDPSQTLERPDIVAAVGSGLMVNTLVAWHPVAKV